MILIFLISRELKDFGNINDPEIFTPQWSFFVALR